MDPSRLLEEYADRGQPRGARQVFAAASAGTLVPTELPGRSRRSRVGLVACLCLIASFTLVLALTATRRSAPERGTPPASDPAVAPPPTMSPEEMAAARARTADLLKRGWVPVAIVRPGEIFGPGKDAPIGYRRAVNVPGAPADNPAPLSESIPDRNGVPRTPIYDRPDGSLIGYRYDNLGFIPTATADDPAFDARALYRQHGQCEPADQECVREANARAMSRAGN